MSNSEGAHITAEIDSGNLTYATDKATVIAFVNFKSGGRRGDAIIHILKRELGENQVFNLGEGNPGQHIEKFRNTPNLRIVACGGDGTVNWILSTVANLNITPPPSVSIIPLGTGNDTSRFFGWGHKLRSERTVVQYIRSMQSLSCPSTSFDRWQIMISIPREKREMMHPFLKSMAEISPEQYQNKAQLLHPQYSIAASTTSLVDTTNVVVDIEEEQKQLSEEPVPLEASNPTASSSTSAINTHQTPSDGDLDNIHLIWSFNNYFSFGIDAQIMDSFHHHRESHPGCYCCRCCTMTWIGLWSPINCCCAKKLPLRMDVEVLLPAGESKEGVESGLPQYEWVPSKLDAESLDAFILLNLPTYAGGRNIWGTDAGKKSDKIASTTVPSTSDGKLEVLGFDSYTHMSTTVALQTSRAHRLHQVMGIRFRIRDNMFIQLDGEAWTQDCGVIEIYRAPSVNVLVNEPADIQAACCDC